MRRKKTVKEYRFNISTIDFLFDPKWQTIETLFKDKQCKRNKCCNFHRAKRCVYYDSHYIECIKKDLVILPTVPDMIKYIVKEMK